MCSYTVERATITGSAKGPGRWIQVDTATVANDHPQHAPLDHAITIDLFGGGDRVAIELGHDSARDLAAAIVAALDRPG